MGMSVKASYARIYREDAQAEEDWTAADERVADNRPVRPEKLDENQVMRNEWVLATLRPNHYYSMPRAVIGPAPFGGMGQAEEEVNFNVLRVVIPHGRPHLMPTWESADDVVLVSGAAVQVQYYDRWGRRSQRPPAITFTTCTLNLTPS
jgi:hypothetical protein